jgi:glycosyltransferase involved in cell wall biosynthesis
MQLKILLLTPIYPSPDLICQTTVVHTFAKEWIKMGHQVRVVHNIVSFPRVVYFIASFFKEFLESKFGTKINFVKVKFDLKYFIDSIEVFRFPMFKFFPHGRYSKNQIQNQIKKIILINEKDGFRPDIVIGHWTNPQIELLFQLKKIYNSKSCLIFHDKGIDFFSKYKKDGAVLLASLDVVGFRSFVIKTHVEKNIKKFPKSFLCYSGLPNLFLDNYKPKLILNEVINYVFVGDLFARKNPTILLKALNLTYGEEPFFVDYVGSGYEQFKLLKTAKKFNQFSKIKLHGKLSQERVKDLLFQTDCFIMLSKNEAFGLVYLEAMAMGCLTICSKNEGIDGIIKHGENGFLCEEGNLNDLSDLIIKIKNLSFGERKKISDKAISTAKKFSNYEMAKKYLECIG